MKQGDILGAWELREFEIAEKNGIAKPWGSGMRGLLIYEPGGRMSVSIQRDIPQSKAADWEPLDDFLFYAGRFEFLSPDSIGHHVEIATDRSRVGQTLQRDARIQGDFLHLSNQTASGSTARIVWKRLP